MAGTVVTTETTHTSVKLIKFDWLSSAAGAADATTTAYFDGLLIKVATVPDGGGTQPSDQYDLTLTTANGIDLLAGQGANRSNVNTEYITSGMGGCAGEKVTLGITNGGNAKGGVVYVYIR